MMTVSHSACAGLRSYSDRQGSGSGPIEAVYLSACTHVNPLTHSFSMLVQTRSHLSPLRHRVPPLSHKMPVVNVSTLQVSQRRTRARSIHTWQPTPQTPAGLPTHLFSISPSIVRQLDQASTVGSRQAAGGGPAWRPMPPTPFARRWAEFRIDGLVLRRGRRPSLEEAAVPAAPNLAATQCGGGSELGCPFDALTVPIQNSDCTMPGLLGGIIIRCICRRMADKYAAARGT